MISLGLELKLDNIIKSKGIKFIVKKILPDSKKQWKRIASIVKNILRTKIQVSEKLNKIMLLSNCAVCDKKSSDFIENKRFLNFNNTRND